MYYKPGDKVRIVHEWKDSSHNLDGLMDKWLGTVMTVKTCRYGDYYSMLEDQQDCPWSPNGWAWYDSMIEGPAAEDVVETEFVSLLM